MKEEFPNLKDANGQKQGLWKRDVIVPPNPRVGGNFSIGQLLTNYKDGKLQGKALTLTAFGDFVMREDYENGVLQGPPKIAKDLAHYYPNWFNEKGSDGLFGEDSDVIYAKDSGDLLLSDFLPLNRLIDYFERRQQLVDYCDDLEASNKPPRKAVTPLGKFNSIDKTSTSPAETPLSQKLYPKYGL